MALDKYGSSLPSPPSSVPQQRDAQTGPSPPPEDVNRSQHHCERRGRGEGGEGGGEEGGGEEGGGEEGGTKKGRRRERKMGPGEDQVKEEKEGRSQRRGRRKGGLALIQRYRKY